MATLSIIIPVFNEAPTIAEVLRRIQEAPLPSGWEKELIVVNDSSTDGTKQIVEEFRSEVVRGCSVRYLEQPANRGKGACIRLGVAVATGDAILIQDADLEYDPRDYQHMVQALLDREADVVYGSRFLAGKRVTTPGHRFINWGLTFFANRFTRLRLTDVHTCLKLFRAGILKQIDLKEDRFGFCPEVTAKLARMPGLKLVEVPVSYQPRARQAGKKIKLRDGLRALYCVVKYSVEALPAPGARTAPARERASRGVHGAISFRPGLVWLWLAIVASLALRLSLFDFQSVDYQQFLSRWYDFFVEHGRWRGLGGITIEFANYPPLYLYLVSLSTLLPVPKLYAIKLLSIACDYLAAWFIWQLARKICPKHQLLTLAAPILFLFLPTIILNGAVWGQCDIMYTTGFLASLLYLLEGRPVAALVAFGFSCALKPQAIFWCPLLAGLLLSRRMPWKWFWVPAAVYAACGVPSMLAGQPVLHVLGHWAMVKNLPGLSLHAPNWYQWVGTQDSSGWWWAGVALTILGGVLFLWMFHKGPPRGWNYPGWLVWAALISVLFPPFFLPGMHERYFFAADILALVYALSVPRGWVVALLMQFASASAYCPFLFGAVPVAEYLPPVAVVLAFEWILLEPRLRRGESVHPAPVPQPTAKAAL